MIKKIGFFFILLCAISCKNQNELPINKDKLIPVLTDIHLAEASVRNSLKNKKDTLLKKYYLQVFEIHGITEIKFDSTIAILKKNPEQFKDIYQQVLEEIDKQKAELK